MPLRSPNQHGTVFSMTWRAIATWLMVVCIPLSGYSQMPYRAPSHFSVKSKAEIFIDIPFGGMDPYFGKGLVGHGSLFQERHLSVAWGKMLVLVQNKKKKDTSKSSSSAKKSEKPVSPAAKEESPLPLEALDLFYAGLGERLKKKSSPDGEVDRQQIKGIRYSFIRETGFNQEEELGDAKKITDDLRDVRLAIEPNRTGYLYVLAPVGRGKWQQIKGKKGGKRKDKLGPAHVKAFQTVEFGLSAIANRFGKPVVGSINVVLSPAKLEHPSQEFKDKTSLSGLMTETLADSIFVVRPKASPDEPFLAEIPL